MEFHNAQMHLSMLIRLLAMYNYAPRPVQGLVGYNRGPDTFIV